MDISAVSEWSSGCESGWTSYLDESSGYPNTEWPQTSMNLHSNIDHHQTRYKEDEEEDLSMVSDASSGPATAPNNCLQLDQDDEYSYDHQTRYNSNFYNTHSSSSTRKEMIEIEKKRKKKIKGKEGKQRQQHSNFLDDTASSPAMTYSQRYVSPSNNQEAASIDHHLWGFSQNFSTTQGNPAMYNHLGGHWQPSYPKDSDSPEPSNFRGGRW